MMSLPEYYYIVFTEAERKYWYMRWLKKGFSHCYLLQAYEDKWIKTESGQGVIRADVVNYEKPSQGCIIVKIKAKDKKMWFSINTCVSLVKAITGLGGRALTPYQLYKRVNHAITIR